MKHEVYLHMNEQLHPNPERIETAIRLVNRKPHLRMKKIAVSLIAVAVLCSSLSLAASADEDFRQALFDISPEIAAAFSPVMRSCVSEGYRMTVEGVQIDGDNSSFIIAFEDLEGTGGEKISCDDSYEIKRSFPPGFDMTSGGCIRLGYDEESNKHRFMICLHEPGANRFWSDTLTFSMPDIIVGIKEQEDMLIPVDWSSINLHPEMQTLMDEPGTPLAMKIGDPVPLVDEIQLTGIGYRGGKLRIQTLIEDWNGDSGACFWLEDANGNRLDSDDMQGADWDEGGHNYKKHWREKRYHESVIEVDEETLQTCTLHAWTRTGGRYIHGNWKVKFPLKTE